jgi:hypothetical protein
VCSVVFKTILELERAILDTLYFAGAENTDNWRTRKGDLSHVFPLDVPMVLYKPSILVLGPTSHVISS